MPTGVGTWYFKNGNTLEGKFSQQKVVPEEGEEVENLSANGNAEPKEKIDLLWKSATNIATAAHQVNSVEQ